MVVVGPLHAIVVKARIVKALFRIKIAAQNQRVPREIRIRAVHEFKLHEAGNNVYLGSTNAPFSYPPALGSAKLPILIRLEISITSPYDLRDSVSGEFNLRN